jgi:hypothetical protein
VVRDRQDKDSVVFNSIDQAVGKFGNQMLPDLSEDNGRHSREPLEIGDRVFDPVKKDVAQAWGFVLVVGRAFEKLPPCQRVPGRSVHLSRERASLKTSSEGMGVTSPRSISR